MLETMLQLNWWVATGVLILEIFAIFHIGLVLVLYFGNHDTKNKVKESINKNINYKLALTGVKTQERYFTLVIFLFALASSIMTLIYSEIFLQVPCALCWFQRIFMYGIVILSGQALWKGEEKNILSYVMTFSVFGFLFALYQHLEQILALYGTNLPCPVSGADCSKMTLYEYGHITFPWMAVVLFIFFIGLILMQKKLK